MYTEILSYLPSLKEIEKFISESNNCIEQEGEIKFSSFKNKIVLKMFH